MSKLAQLAELALEECDRKLWSRTWSGGGCYLHLEVSEFIEALRGKGDPVAEAADVLFVLLSTMSANGVDVDQVIARLEERLTTSTDEPRIQRILNHESRKGGGEVRQSNDLCTTKYEKHVHRMKCLIAAASIARQCHDKMDSGAGAPTVEDMKNYVEEAEAIAELWEEAK